LEREYDGMIQVSPLAFDGIEGVVEGDNNNVLVLVESVNPTTMPEADVGTYPIVVSFAPRTTDNSPNFNYTFNPLTLNAVITQAEQLITFDISGLTKQVGDGTVDLANLSTRAQISSNRLPEYTSNSTNICNVSGQILTIIAAGTCSLTAANPGDDNTKAAIPVTSAFTILAAPASGAGGGGGGAEVKPEIYVPEVKPVLPEIYVPEVKPVLPEIFVPEVKPVLPEIFVPEVKPVLPEIFVPEVKPVLPEIFVPEVKPVLPKPEIGSPTLNPVLQQTTTLTLSLPVNSKKLSVASKRAVNQLLKQAKQKYGTAAKYQLITKHTFLQGSSASKSKVSAKLRRSLLIAEIKKHSQIDSGHILVKASKVKAGKSLLRLKVWLTPKDSSVDS
jgi:hypothetical protein